MTEDDPLFNIAADLEIIHELLVENNRIDALSVVCALKRYVAEVLELQPKSVMDHSHSLKNKGIFHA